MYINNCLLCTSIDLFLVYITKTFKNINYHVIIINKFKKNKSVLLRLGILVLYIICFDYKRYNE